MWKQYGIWIALNVSAVQLSQAGFAKEILESMRRLDGIAHSIHLEITESAFSGDEESIGQVLDALSHAQIAIAIDDFGNGQSSLARLERFPVSYLKLDLLFVKSLENSVRKTEVCKCVINLAHALDLEVIAEGVENFRQSAILKQLGCEYGQGYLFSRPVSPAKAEELIKAQKP